MGTTLPLEPTVPAKKPASPKPPATPKPAPIALPAPGIAAAPAIDPVADPVAVKAMLARARSAMGRAIIYKLGGGGMSPKAKSPANVNNECDCSGFVCWALGISRQTDHPLYVKFNGGWINTDAMVKDATTSTGFFDKLAVPRPGCLVVYGANKAKGRPVGHVGIVTGVAKQDGRTVVTQVIHCSSGNYKAAKDAIQVTAPTVFNKPDAVYAWYAGLNR